MVEIQVLIINHIYNIRKILYQDFKLIKDKASPLLIKI